MPSPDEKPPSASKRPVGATARMASPSRTPRACSPAKGTASKSSSSSPVDHDTVDLMSNPSRTEILRLENELKVKDMELTKVLTESKAIRQTNISMEKAITQLSDEAARLKEKLALAEKTIESKNLELKQANEQRKSAISDQAAAEATVRRLQASRKDAVDGTAEDARAILGSDLKIAQREIMRLQEESKVQDKQMKAKEQALLDAERDIAATLARASRVDELESKLSELGRQLEASQEENKTLDRLYKVKVDELRKQAEKVDQLQESLLAAGAVHNVIKDYERQLQESQVNQKLLNEELARAKVAANRVAMAVANEYKDDNDKVISVKQWLEERRVLQGEISKLKEKLAAAEKATKYEIQMKIKAQCRLKVIEESLKAFNPGKLAAQPRLSVVGTQDTSPVVTSTLNGGTSSSTDQNYQEQSVPAVFYDTLQRELLSLRKAVQQKDHVLKDKEASLDMLAKKVELLMRAMDVDSRRYRREVTALKDELDSVKAELLARGPRRTSVSARVSRG